jgi:hemoglobin
MANEPYKTTPVFDERSLPGAIRNEHSTKADVWGLLRVLEGEVRLVFHDPRREVRVTPDKPAPIPPLAVHHVEVTGPMRMQVEFYRQPPPGAEA